MIGRVAAGAHGIATREELLAAGVTPGEIKHRLGTGALLAEYPGVYRVGHQSPSVETRYLAAVLACGEAAVLSGRAAAHLLGLITGRAPAPEVTAPGAHRLQGVITHRARAGIDPRDVTTWRGIPVTTLARTLVDLAADLDEDELARACHEAGIRHKTTPRHVEAVLERRPSSRGAGKLRAIIRGDVRVTLSKLEKRFLFRLREAELPLPQTNRAAGGRRVDCRWPAHRLTVELDGYRFHNSRYAWEQDRQREREARGRGDEFRRFTYADVVEEPGYMLHELRALLGRRHPN